MSGGRLFVLALLAIVIKGGLAMVPMIAPFADPLLVVSVLAALGGKRWVALLTGLLLGGLQDAVFGQWLGLHAFSQMTIAFALSLLATRMDMIQPFPAVLALMLAAVADWGIQIGLALLFHRAADVVPGPWIWVFAVAVNALIGLFFYRLAIRQGSHS